MLFTLHELKSRSNTMVKGIFGKKSMFYVSIIYFGLPSFNILEQLNVYFQG